MNPTPAFQIGVPRRKLFMIFEFASFLSAFNHLIEVNALGGNVYRRI